jgi:hypothetical protein
MTNLNNYQAAASMQGAEFERFCETWLKINGFRIIAHNWEDPVSEMEIDIVAEDADGELWAECAGSWASRRNGLERTDTIYKKIGVANAVSFFNPTHPRYWLLTSHLPTSGRALRACQFAEYCFDRIEDIGHPTALEG